PQNISEPVPRINGPPRCANGGTFCENFDDYPYRHLKDELQKQEVDKGFFGEDQVPIEPNTRIDDEGAFLCSGTERVIFPKVGKNKNNEWRFIVNQGWEDGYVQGVQVETCKRKGPCNIIGELPQGYTSVCQQKYVYRRLLSLKEDGTFAVDSFQLPSSCCCAYKKDFVPIEPNTRIDDEGTFLCSGTGRVIFPKVGKNKNNEWKFIVNHGWEDGYVQGVQLETCTRRVAPRIHLGLSAEVRLQETAVPKDCTFVVDSFQLPSPCCWAYKDFVGFLRPHFL
ncbi:hypothetical protein NQ318_009964, partial [Aromia moschata]